MRGASRAARVPQVVYDYFHSPAVAAVTARALGPREEHPVIVSAYHPARGWRSYPFRKRVTVSWVRKMRAEGFTEVGLALAPDARHRPGFSAAFTLDEIIRGGTS